MSRDPSQAGTLIADVSLQTMREKFLSHPVRGPEATFLRDPRSGFEGPLRRQGRLEEAAPQLPHEHPRVLASKLRSGSRALEGMITQERKEDTGLENN